MLVKTIHNMTWHGNNITITLFCSPYYLLPYTQIPTSASEIDAQDTKKWAAHWEPLGWGQTLEKKKKKGENYCTVLTKTQEHNSENEGDPHLYGSYIQKPVA